MSATFSPICKTGFILVLFALFTLSLISDTSAQKKTQAIPKPIKPADLEQEAAKASPALAAIYRELSRPSDNYEMVAWNKVKHLLSPGFEDKDLSQPDRLQAAEKILQAVAWHLQGEAGPNEQL